MKCCNVISPNLATNKAVPFPVGKGKAHAAECNGAELGTQAVECASTCANIMTQHSVHGQKDGAGSRPRHHKNSADDRGWATNGYGHDMVHAVVVAPRDRKGSAAAESGGGGLPNGNSSSSSSRQQSEAKQGQSRRQSRGM